jgi:hypothetical protein
VIGKMRGFRRGMSYAPIRPIEDVGTEAANEEARFESWVKRVGETRAGEALTVWRGRPAGVQSSTTLPELLVEAALRKAGVEFRAQVDLGWARPDFVVFVGASAVVLRVQGDYWHSRAGAVANDAAQKDRLERHTVFGLPVQAVVDLWEHDVYESESVVHRAIRTDAVRADGGEGARVRETFVDLVLRTSGLWGLWSFEEETTQTTAVDRSGAHQGVYQSSSLTPSAFYPGRAQPWKARASFNDLGAVRIAPGGVSLTDWSVESWLMFPTNAYAAELVIVGTGANRVLVRLSPTGTAWRVRLNNVVLGNAGVPAVWMHVAVVHASGMASLYWNGALVGSAAVPTVTTSADFIQLGGGVETGGTQVLDEIAIYTRALSADEIRAHFEVG